MTRRLLASGLCVAVLLGGLSTTLHAIRVKTPAPRPAWVPESWKPLPSMSAAAQSASAETAQARDTSAEAWGDPAAGCFALVQSLRVPGTAADANAVAAAARRALSGSPPAQQAPIEATAGKRWPFTASGVRGWTWLDARESETGFLRVESASCFFNQRSPDHCEALCTRVIDSFESR